MSEASELILPPTSKSPAQLKHGKRLTETEKRAIVAAVGVKGSMQQVADEFGVHRNTVSELCKSVRDEVPNSVLGASWRSQMREKAVVSVNRALDDDTDSYKSGAIGVNVLKGLGDFAPDQGNINVQQLAISMPQELVRLMESETAPTPRPQDVVADCTINETE